MAGTEEGDTGGIPRPVVAIDKRHPNQCCSIGQIQGGVVNAYIAAWIINMSQTGANVIKYISLLARVESGKTASLRTLRRVADALNADVRVSLVPRPTGTLRSHASRKGKGNHTRR